MRHQMVADPATTVFSTPSELTKEEYEDLLQQIQTEFTEQECQQELIDASRHNDVDVVRGILSVYPLLSSYQEESTGNTGLHMAAANGHSEVVDLIIRKAPASVVMVPNESGNTPLHWAAANGQVSVISKLLNVDGADVLVKNKAGRSSLTEGFTSNNEQVVRLLLQHESADEDKLVGTKGQEKESSVTHKFLFGSLRMQVTEMAIPDEEDGTIIGQENPDQDTTGYAIWASSLVMAKWLSTQAKEVFDDKVVVELGSGCGLPGLCAAKSSARSRVYLTDWNEKTLENLSHNIDANDLKSTTSAHFMNWKDKATWPVERADVVIGSDLVYQDSMVECLQETVGSLKPSRLFYVAGTRRQGHAKFIAKMQETYVLTERAPPPSFLESPFEDRDEESCFVHFNELRSMEFRLFDFRLRPTDGSTATDDQ